MQKTICELFAAPGPGDLRLRNFARSSPKEKALLADAFVSFGDINFDTQRAKKSSVKKADLFLKKCRMLSLSHLAL